MSQDYLLTQKCPACGSRKESTLKTIKSQRAFECHCCGLVIALRPPVDADSAEKQQKTEEAVAV